MIVSTILRGGLGNCLFGISAVLAYSIKHNCDYYIPTKIENPHSKDQNVFYSPFLKYRDTEPRGIKITYNEPSFEYEEIPKYDCDLLILNGYWQSYLYFNDYLPEIKRILSFDNLDNNYDYVSVHVRRSDYVLFPSMHPVITIDYLRKSIKYFIDKGDYAFLIFSDDINWCRESLDKAFFSSFDYTPEFEYVEKDDEVMDMKYMAMAEHNIIANSSFSLMAAILNNNLEKIVIYPRTWFGKDLIHNTKDLCPGSPNWIAL